ncbi:RuBisCO large subunit C-terminal-like domain-containing protein [uncultured Thiodictyon sp.]|uniref:RuBisCO large subunit C-terminal-like domain-containing protein n=1 Tax=uncultured Thiodictyon sp. TaxID=1846217 RepID=UPI0025DB8E72|nr:RuBisCO large subunit C-terminal-like domain-containing protein [uncultured Thiodictyon sp.]
MTPADLPSFFARREDLNGADFIELDYAFECYGDPRMAAAHLCSEQSTAQWHRVGIDEDYRPRFGAKVLDLQIEGHRPAPSYATGATTGAAAAGEVSVCRVTIAHPHGNFGPRIPNLLSAVVGEGVFFVPGIPLIKLLDLRMPDGFLSAFPGPRFGIEGIRDLLGVHDRPIFFGVIKPNIGLPPEPFAELAYEGWVGGLDVAKDDEMLADAPWCPLAERSAQLGAARRRAEAATGVTKGYMANVTDEVDRLIELHDLAVANGANMLLINALPVGLSAVRMLSRHTRVPLVGHFPMIAALSRLPGYGIHTRVITKLQRLAGLDAIVMPGFGGRMGMDETEVLESVAACTDPLGQLARSLPIPGGSDWAGTLEGVYRRVGSIDFGFIPGRGVFGHPMGPTGGAVSLRQAWDAIAQGVQIDEYAQTHPELSAAIDAFGGRG